MFRTNEGSRQGSGKADHKKNIELRSERDGLDFLSETMQEDFAALFNENEETVRKNFSPGGGGTFERLFCEEQAKALKSGKR